MTEIELLRTDQSLYKKDRINAGIEENQLH